MDYEKLTSLRKHYLDDILTNINPSELFIYDWSMDDASEDTTRNCLQQEQNSLDRVTQILGQDVNAMQLDDLEHIAYDMFFMPESEYETRVKELGLESLQVIDSFILLGVLKARGRTIPYEKLKQSAMEHDSGLGYMDNMFKLNLPAMLWGTDDMHGLHTQYAEGHKKWSEKLEQHIKVDNELTKRHRITQPEFIKTLNYRTQVHAITFAPDGQLLMVTVKRDDSHYGICKLNWQKKWWQSSGISTNVAILTRMLGEEFESSNARIAVSESAIYVGCHEAYDLRMRKNISYKLWEMNREIRKDGFDIVDMTEEEGVFYFAMQHPIYLNCKIVVVEGDDIRDMKTDRPVSMCTSDFNKEHMITVKDGRIYFKANNSVLMTDKYLSEPKVIIDAKDHNPSCCPSNISISPSGLVYAVTQFKDEAAQSIKAYDEKGFATHLYPDVNGGGTAAARRMAISSKGILAYTCFDPLSISFYKLHDAR